MIALLAVVGLVAAWTWFVYRRSAGRMWSPLWLAFSTTALSLLFIATGSAGYILNRRTRWLTGTAWSDTVIWEQVGIGAALVPVAVYLWRRSMRDVDRRVRRMIKRNA